MHAAFLAAIATVLFATTASAQSVELKTLDQTITVSAAALAALPRETLSLTAHGQTHVYEGPALASVLARIEAPLGQALRGAALLDHLVIRAADGYGVVLSLAEIDPAMRSTKVILADRTDGQPIGPEDGPLRLIVEGDTRPARSVRQVVSIELKRAE